MVPRTLIVYSVIYIRVEVWPGGNWTKAEVVSETVVVNISDLAEESEYYVKASQQGGFKPKRFTLNALTQSGKHRSRFVDPEEDSVLIETKVRHQRSKGIWALLREVTSRIARELKD